MGDYFDFDLDREDEYQLTDNQCPYCGAGTNYVSTTSHYDNGTRYPGRILRCNNYPKCDSYVGCHVKSGYPKGSLANAELRAARQAAHAAFDTRWKSRDQTRAGAYFWLSRVMDIDADNCHIGMFTIEQCQAVQLACLQELF